MTLSAENKAMGRVIGGLLVVLILGAAGFYAFGKKEPQAPVVCEEKSAMGYTNLQPAMLEKVGDKFALDFNCGEKTESIYVMESAYSLDQWIGRLVKAEYDYVETEQQIQCIKEPCDPVKITELKVFSIGKFYPDWKTFTNDRYGFELEIPRDWEAISETSYNVEGIFIRPKTHLAKDPLVLILPNEGSDTGLPESSAKVTQTVFAGEPAEQREWANLTTIKILSEKPGWSTNNRIQIRYQGQQELIDDILWTFKFTEPIACIQVITPAVNPSTGETKDFPTPCDIPEGWKRLQGAETDQESTTQLKSYENKELNFSLLIPQAAEIKFTANDEHNRLILFDYVGDTFEVRIREADSSLENYYYLDNNIDSTGTLGEERANIYKSSSGYCDGPGCTKPFISYVAKFNQDFYHLTFYGDTKISDEEKIILDSFSFLTK